MSRVALWLVVVIALGVFILVTAVIASTGLPTGLDSHAFRIADDLGSPVLEQAARVVTKFGLLVVVGPAVAVAALVLVRAGRIAGALGLVAGTALTSAAVWLVKALVGRPRPPHPLVHTVGQSYPSAHAANSVGWVALALALSAVIPARAGRVSAVIAGIVLAVLVGLSRIYLRAHYLTDVVGGEALAVSMYALAAIGSLAWGPPPRPATAGHAAPRS